MSGYTPVARPWSFEYDADAVGDPLEFRTTEAAILGPKGELIVEEPGPEATWVELEHIVLCVNAHDELLEGYREILRTIESGGDANNFVDDIRAAIAKAEGGADG